MIKLRENYARLSQARFQQKQLQEKEQKLLQLYDQQQQRAYQVVQRGSAGSNGSNHTATISQHTVTKTSSSSHTTSTSQGGKVRQMFDERRQTTVKGIDRSYPLEPLENKPRKQANGNSVQKNGNLTVNRQSVTVRRVARADVNSNLNGGKPVVSYHEEITRESFGPSARQHQGDDEFGNENHVGRYTNGNHRDGIHIEEVLDEDMIERNRMMAKLHLMEYDESLKHRVKNDLESEEFPEDFMVDVPDKLPKQSVTKKLSQAEARLERFKNANVKRGSYVTKNPTIAPKKRSDPIFPAKSTSSEDRATKAGSYEVSDGRKKGPASNELRAETLIPEITGETLSPDSARYVRRRDDNPRFFCKESEKSATTYAIDSRTAKKLSPELPKGRMQRSDRSRSFTVSREFEKYPTGLNVTRTSTFKSPKDGVRGKQSPKLFSEDAGKLTASSAIDLKNVRKLPSEMSKDVKERSKSSKYFCKESEKSATARAIDPKSAERLIQEVSKVVKDVKRRSESPKFFCKESEKSATTYAIDPKTADKSTRVSLRDMRDVKSPSESPAFFCKESEKSATTYAVDPKTTKRFSADIKKRGESPKYFGKESGKPATTHAIDPRATKKFSSGSLRDTKDRTDGPKFFCKESEKSATTYAVDSRSPSVSPDSTKNRESSVPKMEKSEGKKDTIKESMNDRIKRHIKSLKHDAIKRSTFPKYLKQDANYPRGSKSTPAPKSSSFPTRERSSSPHFFFREGRKSTRKKSTDDQSVSRLPNFNEKNIKKRSESPRIASITDAVKSKSPDFAKISCRKSSPSPQYLSDSDRSTTFMMVTPKTITKPRTEFAYSKSREQSPALSVSKSENAVTGVPAEPKRNDSSMKSYDESSRQFIRSSVSRFFSEQCEKATRNADVRKHVQSAKIGKKEGYSSRGSSPLSLKDMRTPSPTKPQFYRGRTEKADRRTSVDTDSSRDSSPKYRKIVDSGEETPGFRRETEKSVATAGLEPRISRNVIKGSSQSPTSIKQAVLREISTKTKNLLNNVKNKSRSPNNLTAKDSNSTSKDKNIFNRRGSGNTLRSTKLTRDAAKGNSTTKNTNLLNRRGSSNALCSTKLIRDALKRQNGRNRALLATEKSRSEISSGRVQEVTTANKKVDERAGTSTVGELSAARSSLRSCTSAEMDTDVRGIVMSDECIKQEKLRGTYSRSSNKTAGGRPGSEKLFTYSVRKPVKRRGSLLGSNMFERSVKNSREEKPISSRYKSPNASLQREETVVGSIKSRTKGNVASEKSERNTLRSEGRTAGSIQTREKNMTSSKSCRTRSINRDPKRRIEGSANRRSETKISRVVGGQTSSPFESQEKKGEVNSTENSLDETKETKTLSEQVYILKSVSLVQNVTKEPDFTEKSRKLIRETIPDGTVAENQITKSGPAPSIDIKEPELIVVSIPSSKNYERTDSVESALRRFDSIGMETGSIRGTWKRSAESIAEKRQTKSGETGSTDDSRTISLGALDRPEADGKGRQGKPRGTSERKNAQKKLEGIEDSMEMTRIALRSRSPSCRRKLFRDGDSGDSETGSTASRCSLDSTRTVKHLSALFNKNQMPGSMNTASKRFKFSASNETLTEMTDKGEADQVSTGVDRSVKQLRSIEDIRRSIEDESPDRKRGKTSAKSAIVGNALRDLSVAKATARSVPRRINIDDRAGNRKEISLPRRSGNVTASNDALGDTGRSSVKCTMRFSRVAKSPSPETTKATETSTRARRTVPAPPSKSPDTVARRPSTELKAQDTKSTRRPTPMKGTEPTGNRKMTTTTTTTSASTKKSTDVVDGAFLENGLHLRDQTAETKYDNDSLTTKKNDAFVIDFDEQPPKENDAPLPRKSLLRKQSTEKQITSAQSARPPSSVSSTSSGSSMQGQTSGLKSKMASRAKTPISGSTSYKGSASSKIGSAATDALVPCKMCGRRFAQDRITLHEQICAKTMQKKRKQFDTMMYRVKGTDLEPFVKKGLAKKQLEKSKKPEVKSNWRRKHEDFINAIRSAKQVQAHLAAGGKLSDLPPPPVSDNCDYIQCPHCGRKFNKAAAERHIPKCEHMLHNKPIHSRAPKPKR
ncbi:hypothetical protein K0M31_013971 [Melipona bicolor]|uniref:C2HC/C3H-type domain-containing protein n=1 Tax=Melipona bicolor TaxID=60889 RepID=A0AA40KTU5_9HYME|nr:hypothetical protein K0M31_013971 [Melipona bicolor]